MAAKSVAMTALPQSPSLGTFANNEATSTQPAAATTIIAPCIGSSCDGLHSPDDATRCARTEPGSLGDQSLGGRDRSAKSGGARGVPAGRCSSPGHRPPDKATNQTSPGSPGRRRAGPGPAREASAAAGQGSACPGWQGILPRRDGQAIPGGLLPAWGTGCGLLRTRGAPFWQAHSCQGGSGRRAAAAMRLLRIVPVAKLDRPSTSSAQGGGGSALRKEAPQGLPASPLRTVHLRPGLPCAPL